MSTKNILSSPGPNLTGVASPEFFKNEFDGAIWLKGYDVILERALRCPCHAPDAPLINCQNCLGTGYFYINPTKTKALITGINQNNQYKNWTEALLGTISITVRDVDKSNMSYLDRVTIEKEFSYYSENLVIRKNETNSFVFTTYKATDVKAIYLFISSSEKLFKLDKNDYSINPNNPYCIIFNEDLSEEQIASVYYQHNPQYLILDLPHEIRASWVKDKKTGELNRIELPVQGIGRRCHLINIEKPNFDGGGTIINDNI